MVVSNNVSAPLFDMKLYSTPHPLKYTVQENKAVFIDESIKDSEQFVTYFDIQDIDVSDCSFDDFCKVLHFAKESSTAYEFDEDFLVGLLPQEALDGNKHNYIEIYENLKFNFAIRGDMQLFHETQKIVSAASWFLLNKNNDFLDRTLTEDGFYVTNLFENGLDVGNVYYESFVLGESNIGIGDNVYRLKAYYATESTEEHPVISVSTQYCKYTNNNSYDMPEYYSVAIDELDFHNMSAIEMFAYMSYIDSKTDGDWYTNAGANELKKSFQNLLDCEIFDFNNFDELKSQKFDYYDLLQNAKDYLHNYDSSKKHYGWLKDLDPELTFNVSISFNKTYIEELLELFDYLLDMQSNK